MEFIEKKISTRIGELFLLASPKGLRGVFWKNLSAGMNFPSCHPQAEILELTEKQISEYLQGKRLTFDLPLDIRGTEFQKKVWKTLRDIPYGFTRSYSEIARAAGYPGASRAVGTANRNNPLCLIVPCHRVITSGGTIGGYSGGIERKRDLLDMEKAHISEGRWD